VAGERKYLGRLDTEANLIDSSLPEAFGPAPDDNASPHDTGLVGVVSVWCCCGVGVGAHSVLVSIQCWSVSCPRASLHSSLLSALVLVSFQVSCPRASLHSSLLSACQRGSLACRARVACFPRPLCSSAMCVHQMHAADAWYASALELERLLARGIASVLHSLFRASFLVSLSLASLSEAPSQPSGLVSASQCLHLAVSIAATHACLHARTRPYMHTLTPAHVHTHAAQTRVAVLTEEIKVDGRRYLQQLGQGLVFDFEPPHDYVGLRFKNGSIHYGRLPPGPTDYPPQVLLDWSRP